MKLFVSRGLVAPAIVALATLVACAIAGTGRALAQRGLDLAHDTSAPIVNLVRQPEFLRYLESGDYREPIVVVSGRDARMTLSLQLVPFSLDKKMLMSRDVTQLEELARMRRD